MPSFTAVPNTPSEFELYPDATMVHLGHTTLGHAVRLPLGIHRLSGRRYALFDAYGLPCAFTATEAALRFVLTWPPDDVSYQQR